MQIINELIDIDWKLENILVLPKGLLKANSNIDRIINNFWKVATEKLIVSHKEEIDIKFGHQKGIQ
jgi:hypothetical protein